MPIKLFFTLTLSFACAALLCRYIGWQYPLSSTAGGTLDPVKARWIVWATEVVWLATNVYSLHLLHSTWRQPPGLLRVTCAVVLPVLFYAQYFLGYYALEELDHFMTAVPPPWP